MVCEEGKRVTPRAGIRERILTRHEPKLRREKEVGRGEGGWGRREECVAM